MSKLGVVEAASVKQLVLDSIADAHCCHASVYNYKEKMR